MSSPYCKYDNLAYEHSHSLTHSLTTTTTTTTPTAILVIIVTGANVPMGFLAHENF